MWLGWEKSLSHREVLLIVLVSFEMIGVKSTLEIHDYVDKDFSSLVLSCQYMGQPSPIQSELWLEFPEYNVPLSASNQPHNLNIC